MCPKHVEEHNYRNKILCIKLESETNYHQDARSTTHLKKNEGGYMRQIAGSHFGCYYEQRREDPLRRTRCDLRTRGALCIEVDGGIFELLLWTVTGLSFKK